MYKEMLKLAFIGSIFVSFLSIWKLKQLVHTDVLCLYVTYVQEACLGKFLPIIQ